MADILNNDTNITVIDSAGKPKLYNSTEETNINSLIEYPDILYTELKKTEKVDFSSLLNLCEDNDEDLLCDTYFESMHQKSHKAEKRIRKTDRERAQHDKDRVVKLLEGLRGHCWLKLMGVNCLMESKKKEYESARQYFIVGCESILVKFRLWRDEEKRKKEEKKADFTRGKNGQTFGNSQGNLNYHNESDYSAARQLIQEATAGSSLHLKCQKRSQFERLELKSYEPYEIGQEFKSFFSKPYLRELALGKQRRTGRTVFAWGHPIPEIFEKDFDLPEELRDEETLRAHARRKRRDERIKKKAFSKT